MRRTTINTYIGLLLIVGLTACLLSWLWKVPYLYTAIGFSCLVLLGHFVTIDDDMPGGWSNPDGDLPFPWAELSLKALVPLALTACAVAWPALRQYGA